MQQHRGFASTAVVFSVLVIALLVATFWYWRGQHDQTTPIVLGTRPEGPLTSPSSTVILTGMTDSSSQSSIVTNPSLTSYEWANVPGGAPKTYTDPNGTFSIQYLGNYTVIPSPTAGMGYEDLFCSASACPTSSRLSENILGIQPPGFEFPNPSINTALAYIAIAYGSSTSESFCEQPGGSSSTIATYSFDTVPWHWGRFISPLAGVDSQWGQPHSYYSTSSGNLTDQFQAYYGGACWGVQFGWGYFGGPLNDAPVLPFERAAMATFRFLNSANQPSYVPYNPNE